MKGDWPEVDNCGSWGTGMGREGVIMFLLLGV